MTKRVLTEAEILAAPKKDYMNAQLQFFRRRLLSLRDQLLENLRDTSEHLRTTESASDLRTVPPRRRSRLWSFAPVTASANCSTRSMKP